MLITCGRSIGTCIQSLSGIDRSSQVSNQVIVKVGMPVGYDIYHHEANHLVQKRSALPNECRASIRSVFVARTHQFDRAGQHGSGSLIKDVDLYNVSRYQKIQREGWTFGTPMAG